MFRWQPILWNTVIWIWCFMFILMKNYDPQIRSIPLVMLFITLSVLIALISTKPKKTKSVLLFIGWCFFVALGVLLQTTGHYTGETLNIHVFIFTFIASCVWCLIGHNDNVTEPGTYWFIWSLTIVISLAAVFNDESQTAIILYITNAAFVFVIHVAYTYKICRDQPANDQRCRHIFRVVASIISSLSLLICSVCFKAGIMDESDWDISIICILAVVLLFIIVDGMIGFSQRAINTYSPVPQQP